MYHPSERIALAAQDRSVKPAEWLQLVDSMHGSPGFWWLDSAMTDERLGRLSFAGADPYLWLQSRGSRLNIDVRRSVRSGLQVGHQQSTGDPIEMARSLTPRADSLLYSTATRDNHGRCEWREVAGLSDGLDLPFVGGAVGYFGYELAAEIEPRIRFDKPNDFDLPDLSLAFVDQVLAYDHAAERLWLFGLGFGGGAGEPVEPESYGPREFALRASRARVEALESRVTAVLGEPRWRSGLLPFAESDRDVSTAPVPRAVAPASTARSPVRPAAVESTTDASGYAKAVDSILEEIELGNVYQANFSQRLSVPAPFDTWLLYTELRRANPAPFGAYLSLPDGVEILSSSPERFLAVASSRHVESRPIKGTRPRGQGPLEDRRLADELAGSEKDQAENLMIVDLVRNDLGRVCAPGSIEVPELMKIEAYAAVFQMVSTVTGTLATGKDAFDLIEGTFPPGSMTGAPKLASIGLLDRLESVRRGVYAGALGYLDVRGGLDLSVVIRTFVCKAGRATLHVGGGVVADSSPEGEYLESLDKARAPLAALAATTQRVEAARRSNAEPGERS